MTDKKHIDEDTISSLELIATTRNCNKCKIRNCKWGTCNCEQVTANAALDLIKCQKIEIERLQKEVNLVSIQFQDLQEQYEEAQAEIEKLKANLNIELENYATEYDNKIKSEAVKEFAEKLKNEINIRTTYSREQDKNVMRMIDNLVKEIVGNS